MEKLKLKKLLFCADVLVNLLTICAALDTITVNQTIRDGETIVSAGYVFELGFFSRNGSTNRYLGIWYKEPPGSYVWVPNAGKPINDTSGVLKLSSDGRLLLLSGNDTIWASWFANSNTINPVAQLLDTGNLVVRDAVDQENIIWQSNPPYDCVRSGTCGPYGTCNRSPTRMMIEVPPTYETDTETKKVIKVVLPASFTFFVVLLILIYMEKEEPTQHTATKGRPAQTLEEDYTNESQREPAALPSFSLSKITNATNNFSIYNKLGQGGFGPVYKGVLEGQEIAVKRMSKTSSQGFNEFKNEVRCIAKLQHRNLVKLLGYCIQRDEFLLIYEYMPNKSLDSFIFDEVKSLMLGWPSRFRIIHGIARGLLYLHQDSRLRIIHRDLKAGNILLDQDMNPKISDFGLARRFRGQENEANTNKVVGTLGYISPEYAANGQFSIKSDVFSFGVLLLEMVSGKKNRGFTHQDHSDNLLGHAWRLYKSGKFLELLSATLCNSCVDFEVLRTIHIGLLCVQDHAEDRPTMLSVVSMLGSEGPLPPPKQPAFFTEKTTVELNPIPSLVSPPSIDCATITILDAR